MTVITFRSRPILGYLHDCYPGKGTGTEAVLLETLYQHCMHAIETTACGIQAPAVLQFLPTNAD